MRNTGFSEIKEERLYYNDFDPWYIEIALTGECNFNCKYCNRFYCKTDYKTIEGYFNTFGNCKHVQLTGGEPTLHKDFKDFVNLCRNKSKKVGLSTNGTHGLKNYLSLSVDMFSISLDDYDCNILLDRGYKNPGLIIETIRALSKEKYVNIGLVIDQLNIDRIENIIDFILSLGVHDIKLSTNTKDELLPEFTKSYDKYPILSYRVNNFNNNKQMRGNPPDTCGISVNDVTIVGDKHYPCLVYFREGGKAIGYLSSHKNVYKERYLWYKSHNATNDVICNKYCMDFKCEFNKERERIIS